LAALIRLASLIYPSMTSCVAVARLSPLRRRAPPPLLVQSSRLAKSLNSVRKFIPRAFESFANTRENIDPRISRSFFDPL